MAPKQRRPPIDHIVGISYNSNCPGPCDICREGKRAYWQARQQAVKDGHATPATHGVSGYRQGCRCGTCRTGVRDRMRELRQRKRRTEPAATQRSAPPPATETGR